MFKIALDKELKKIQREEEASQEALLGEAKALLDGNAEKELALLKKMSPSSRSQVNIGLHEKVLNMGVLREKYQGEVYTKDQIKDLAIKYCLRFLNAGLFKGSFDAETGLKLSKFIETQDLTFKENGPDSIGQRFFILAPEESFNLTKKNHTYASERRAIERRLKDPILFYKVPGHDLYVKIHKWGEDFTVFRYIEGLRNKTFWGRLLFHTFALLPVTAAFTVWLFELEAVFKAPLLAIAFSFFISFVFSYFKWSFLTHDEGKQVDLFFSPKNWNSEETLR